MTVMAVNAAWIRCVVRFLLEDDLDKVHCRTDCEESKKQAKLWTAVGQIR